MGYGYKHKDLHRSLVLYWIQHGRIALCDSHCELGASLIFFPIKCVLAGFLHMTWKLQADLSKTQRRDALTARAIETAFVLPQRATHFSDQVSVAAHFSLPASGKCQNQATSWTACLNGLYISDLRMSPQLHPLATHHSICCGHSHMPTSKRVPLNRDLDLAESQSVAAHSSHEAPFSGKHTTQRWNIYLGLHTNSASWCVCSLLVQWAAKLTCTADSVTEATTDSFLLLTLASVKVNCVSLLHDVPCLANSSSSRTLTPVSYTFLPLPLFPIRRFLRLSSFTWDSTWHLQGETHFNLTWC